MQYQGGNTATGAALDFARKNTFSTSLGARKKWSGRDYLDMCFLKIHILQMTEPEVRT